MFCVATDRLAAIRETFGVETADLAVARVAETIVRTLRSSDIVARVDDGRVFAVLPNAGATDAFSVAVAVRTAIANAGKASKDMPVLTASIGVATYPDHAEDAPSLLAAADESLRRAQLQGRGRIEPAEAPEPAYASCAG